MPPEVAALAEIITLVSQKAEARRSEGEERRGKMLSGIKKIALALGGVITVAAASAVAAGVSETVPPASVKRCDCDCSCDYCLSGACEFKRGPVDETL